MTLTPRQMLILLGLIVGFGVTAYVVSQDDGDAPEIDEALWCSEAAGLAGSGPILLGEADDATVEELDALKQALFDVETIAPFDLWDDIAVLADFALIAGQERAELAWPEAFSAARENKGDSQEQAISDLAIEMSACGMQLNG